MTIVDVVQRYLRQAVKLDTRGLIHMNTVNLIAVIDRDMFIVREGRPRHIEVMTSSTTYFVDLFMQFTAHDRSAVANHSPEFKK
jgi:hypothetical protein